MRDLFNVIGRLGLHHPFISIIIGIVLSFLVGMLEDKYPDERLFIVFLSSLVLFIFIIFPLIIFTVRFMLGFPLW